jgi:hypothetical protein
MTAPVASGWSGCRVGLTPTGKRRLFTAHTLIGHREAAGSLLAKSPTQIGKVAFSNHPNAGQLVIRQRSDVPDCFEAGSKEGITDYRWKANLLD